MSREPPFEKEIACGVQTPAEYLAQLGPERPMYGFQFVTRLRAVARLGESDVVALSDVLEQSPVYRIGRRVSYAYLEQVAKAPAAWGSESDATKLVAYLSTLAQHEREKLDLLAYDAMYDGLEHYRLVRSDENVAIVDAKGQRVVETIDKPRPPQVLIMTDDRRWNGPYLAALRATGLCVRQVRRYDEAMEVLSNSETCRGIRIVFASMFIYTNGVPPEELALAALGSRTGLVLHMRVLQHPALRDVDCILLTCANDYGLKEFADRHPRTSYIRTMDGGPHYQSPAQVAELAMMACS